MFCSYFYCAAFLVIQRSYIMSTNVHLFYVLQVFPPPPVCFFLLLLLLILLCLWLLLSYQNYKLYVVYLSIFSYLSYCVFSVFLIVKGIINWPPSWNSSSPVVWLTSSSRLESRKTTFHTIHLNLNSTCELSPSGEASSPQDLEDGSEMGPCLC